MKLLDLGELRLRNVAGAEAPILMGDLRHG